MSAAELLPWVAVFCFGLTIVLLWVATRQSVEHDPKDERLSEWYNRYSRQEKVRQRQAHQRRVERHFPPKGGDA